jgi:SSS family solute:Na+ symporter
LTINASDVSFSRLIKIPSSDDQLYGLIGACVVTSVWYLLGDPFGINNMYIALLTPAVIMVLDRLIPNKADRKAPAPVQHNGV